VRSPKISLLPALRRLSEQALEVTGLEGLARLLTRQLPKALGLPGATLLLWNRKLDSFESLSPGETQLKPLRSEGAEGVEAPRARYLLSEGQLLENPGGTDEGVLVPLLARSGLAGMLVLPPRHRRRKAPFRPSEVRLLSALASRAALAIENHHYQRELIASERMAALGTMAGMLAHDFRGPMTVIRGYAETLEAGDSRPEEVRERATLIVEMVDRLDRMTAETLDFARGGGRLVRRPMALASLLEDLASAAEIEAPGLQVVRHFEVPAMQVAVDIDKLHRVVGNIASNARDAMGGCGRLHLRAQVEDGKLMLLVTDEGPGVPSEIRDSLFEPFVTRGKKKGTGLGLAVARQFVEDHGGSLSLLDPEPGGGAAFRIELPLHQV
jgi:signal transduction histidine kinase